VDAKKRKARRGESDLSGRELRGEEGEEVIDRETTSFVNAQNIIDDSEEQRREGLQRGETDE
jgi:hypothetical protein